MYPDAKIPSNAGNPGADWNAKARAAGFNGTKPQGATDISSNNDGTFTITINGKPTKCNADGSVFTPNNNNNGNGNVNGNNNNGSVSGNNGNSNGSAGGGNNGSVSGNNGNGNGSAGGGNNGSVFNYNTLNGGFTIDQNIFTNAAMNLNAAVDFGSQVPYGLGGMLTQANFLQVMQQFVDSVSFNFDETTQSLQMPGISLPAITGITPSGNTTITDSNGNQKTIDQVAEENGYTKTETNGVYKKGNKYYRYDITQQKFVELTGDAERTAKKANEDAATKAKKAKKLEEIKKQNQENATKGDDIAGRIFKAVKGSGTDEEALSKAVSEINADNVLAVFDAWTGSSSYAQSYGEDSVIGAIQDDCSGSYQTGMEAKIKDALYARSQKVTRDLQEYGLDEDATALERAANELKNTVESEHNSWHSSDDTVRSAFDSFVPQLRAAEQKLKETLTPAS